MTDLLLLLGAAVICAGAFMWSMPAGVIAAGLTLIAGAIVLERAGVKVRVGDAEGDGS